MCFSKYFSSGATTATLLLYIHMYASGSASMRLLRVRQARAVQNARNCSAVSLHMQYSDLSAHSVCVLWNSSIIAVIITFQIITNNEV